MSSKKDKYNNKDKLYMNLALKLARARHGLTGPNPSVGCVIVKNGQIISIGQTGFGGRPHAEYNAIKSSYENLKDSTMYVTLEPCNHYGKTPPCTNIIVSNKIKKVFYGIEDIDLKVKGKTSIILKSKNIIVKKGPLSEKIKSFYEPYIYNRKFKIPYITGKIAISKNKLIYSKEKKKITDIYSDKFTHLLRYKNDALMISYKTLNIDNPKLNCRIKGLSKFSPKRIILDKNLTTKIDSYIFKTAVKNNTIIFYQKANKKIISKFKRKGIKLVKSNLLNNKYFDLKPILSKLYKLDCRNLLVEGGDELSRSFIKKKLYNKFYLFKSSTKLSKTTPYKGFNSFKYLTQNYKSKSKIRTKIGKDTITLYRK